jgi:ABC-type lipoprotein export system ATPase subunit
MIELKNIGKIYKVGEAKVAALSDVDITFPDRGMVFVLGKSGSGKSTLLNLVAGFDVPSGGEIFVDGKRLGKEIDYDGYRNNTIGFIFQEFNLNKSLNAEQNVLLSERLGRGSADGKSNGGHKKNKTIKKDAEEVSLAADITDIKNQPNGADKRDKITKKKAEEVSLAADLADIKSKPNGADKRDKIIKSVYSKKKAEEVLLAVGLKDKAKKKVNRLSGGERQRVAIARALIKKPKLILADEPTGKLDEINGKTVFGILKKLSEKILVVAVSHDRENAEKYADRIIELSDGKILSDRLKNPNYIAETTVGDDGIYLLQGQRLCQNDLDILNGNKDKKIILSKETKFVKKRGSIPPTYVINNENDRPTPTPLPRRGIAENNDGNTQNNNAKSVGNNAEKSRGNNAEKTEKSPENRPENNAKKAKNKGLRLNDIFFLAYKNLTSRIFKTLSTVLICVVLFATLGLSAVIVSYNEYQAAAHTFVKNGESDVIIMKKNGGKMSKNVIDDLKNDYSEGYLELYPLFGFEFPDYLAESDTDNLTAITGVFEMEESDLSKLGYTLMNFADVPNIFSYLSEPPQNPYFPDFPDGFPENILDSPEDILAFYTFARFLSENSDVVEYINDNPDLLDELQNNPNFAEDLENDPNLPEILKNNPEFWEYLRENPQILEYPEYFSPENAQNTPDIPNLPDWFDPSASIPDGVIPDWFDPSAPLLGGIADDPQFGGIPEIENAETVGDLLILLLNNDAALSFQSRFPTTSLPAAEYAGGLELNEIVITDFLAYTVTRRLGDFIAPYYDLNIPTEGEDLRAFLNGGFEAVLIDCFNKLNSVLGFSNLRVVGVLDTGYKEKYFKYIDDPSPSVEAAYLNYAFNATNYYSQLFAAEGFSKNCYNGRLLTDTFHFSTEQSGILAEYSNMNSVKYAEDYSLSALLADDEMILTENAFIHLFGKNFNDDPKIYRIQNAVDGILFKDYKVVGVIKNAAAENLFEKDFGAVLSKKGFAETVDALGALSAIRVSIESNQASALFSYMEKNGLQSVSIYSTLLSYIAPTIENLKTVFLPVAILIALIALTAMPMFLVTAITKKQKDIGVMKALGMKTRDVIKIYFVESAATVISVLILSSFAVGLVYNIANIVIAGAVERFMSPELVKLVVLLYMTELPYVINILSILIIGVASVIYPTVKISKLSPVDAMKKE